MGDRRGRLEIYHDILSAIKEDSQNNEKISPTRVQFKSNQSQMAYLSWLIGNPASFQKLTPGVNWIPFQKGVCAATSFVWQSIGNPTALSPPLSMEFFVK